LPHLLHHPPAAPKFQELVEDGPAAYHIPPKLLQQLLAVALHRPRNIQLSYNGLPDLRTFSLFMAPPTGEDDSPHTGSTLVAVGHACCWQSLPVLHH
jgi:hypothetical protein